MQLLLIRHGPAGDRSAWNGPDSERPLTVEGREVMRLAVPALPGLVPKVDVLATSPFTRAYETAEIVAQVYDGMPLTGPLLGRNVVAPRPAAEPELFDEIERNRVRIDQLHCAHVCALRENCARRASLLQSPRCPTASDSPSGTVSRGESTAPAVLHRRRGPSERIPPD